MKFIRERGPVPLLGVEAEVLGWQDGVSDVDKVAGLVQRESMPPDIYTPNNQHSGWGTNKAQHKYHCNCPTCSVLGNYIYHPPQFKMQYDASLPVMGAEFISCPFPAVIPIIDRVVDDLVLIGEGSYGPDAELKDQKGRPAEAGLHIHASVSLDDWAHEKKILDDAIRIFYYYFPEIFLIASSGGRQRSMHYRWPRYNYDDHHSFLIKTRGHLEWRIFEAELGDPMYLFGSMIFASSLTYLLLEPKIMATLEAIGIQDRWDMDIIDDFYKKGVNDQLPEGAPINQEASQKMTDLVLSQVDTRRMDAITTVLSELTYSVDVWNHLKSYLDRAWAFASL